MTIGFSNDHDAIFMNRLAQAGSEIGNFIFINSESENKKQDILNALEESLAIAIEGNPAYTLCVKNIGSGFELGVPIRAQECDDFLELECEFVINSQELQQDLRLTLKQGKQTAELPFFDLVPVDPTETEFCQALLKSANLQIFKSIQRL